MMSKIATYLNEHLTGEVVRAGKDIANASVDGSVLLQQPEIVAHVANTSDIRKIARFSWQLAEKGHVLPITARGYGTDATGAAIGTGVVIDSRKYLNHIIGIDLKQRLIHVQAGASYNGVNLALSTQRGMTLPQESFYGTSGSIGGAIASGAAGLMNFRYGTVGDAIKQLEVVLANGDILQTGRVSKRELNAKKGLSTYEGEIYRQIDNLLSDNAELISSLAKGADQDTSGYAGIAHVKRKDGSIDLLPLFVGSQGSLGIISEVIMQAQFDRPELSAVIAAYDSLADAQTAADAAVGAPTASVEIIDGRLIERAARQGKKREFAPKECFKGAIVIALFDDFNERARTRGAKKLLKQLEKVGNAVHLSTQSYSSTDVMDIRALLSTAAQPAEPGIIAPEAFRGAWLPSVQFDGFLAELRKLEAEYGIALPVYIDARSGFVDFLPEFDIKKVSDRQKLLKLLTALAQLLDKHEGTLAGQGGDGRMKALALQKTVDADVQALYDQIRQIFDPHGILNPGIKGAVEAKDLVSQMNAWCRTAN